MHLQVHEYKWKNPWPTVLILWAVHWNEKAWTKAIQKVIKSIEQWTTCVAAWVIQFVPICNPLAYEKHKRYCDTNLNRTIWVAGEYWVESLYKKEIELLIELADVVLDLHTNHYWDEPFLFLDRVTNTAEKEWAHILHVWMYVYWRKSLYYGMWWTTSEYAHTLWKLSLTVECGDHNSPYAAQRWVLYIMQTLHYFGLLSLSSQMSIIIKNTNAKHVMIKKIIFSSLQSEYVLSHDKKHWDTVIYDRKQRLLLLPNHNALPWDEWLYLWEEIHP